METNFAKFCLFIHLLIKKWGPGFKKYDKLSHTFRFCGFCALESCTAANVLTGGRERSQNSHGFE